MAFSNTYDTTNPGAGVSNREDLTDVLTILAPEETPILSSAQKQKASATFVEWTVDALATPSSTGIREGADVSTFTDQFAGRARLGNYVQKFRRDYMVSDLQEAVDSVGPAKIAQAEAKAIRELKRDVEKTIAGSQDRAVENGSDTAYALRGLGRWLEANASDSDVPSGFRTPADSRYSVAEAGSTALNEAGFNDIITSIFKETGTTNDLTLVADTKLRRLISDFARVSAGATENIRSVNYDGGAGEIKLTVDLYQSDHGIVSIVNGNPDCMPDFGSSAGEAGYLINPEYVGIHELIPMGSTRLPNQGGGERGYVDCALTLAVYHPQAHGVIEGIS
tara:strand:+ start:312 stop:1319 length:1008 start_codon:yes stop_codon:yes gene_type:complete